MNARPPARAPATRFACGAGVGFLRRRRRRRPRAGGARGDSGGVGASGSALCAQGALRETAAQRRRHRRQAARSGDDVRGCRPSAPVAAALCVDRGRPAAQRRPRLGMASSAGSMWAAMRRRPPLGTIPRPFSGRDVLVMNDTVTVRRAGQGMTCSGADGRRRSCHIGYARQADRPSAPRPARIGGDPALKAIVDRRYRRHDSPGTGDLAASRRRAGAHDRPT